MRVTLVGRLDAGVAMGGGEVQLFATANALRERGVEVSLWSPGTDDPGDLLHFFGCFGYFDGIDRWVRARGVPTVFTPIFTQRGSVAQMPGKARRHKFISRKFNKGIAELAKNAKAICGTSSWELDKFSAYFGSPLPPLHRLPNGVETRFADGDADAFRREFGIAGDFVLYVGRIERDKGLLSLIEALRGSEFPLVVVGAEGRRRHVDACRRAAGPAVKWIGPIPHASSLMPGAYAACRVFALPSVGETFCLSAAEAVVAGKRVVLGERWNPKENFGEACLPVSDRPTEIRRAVEQAWSAGPVAEEFRRQFASEMTWERVADRLAEIYDSVLSSKR